MAHDFDHLSTFGSTREQAFRAHRKAIAGYLEAAHREGVLVGLTAPAERQGGTAEDPRRSSHPER
jgi:predicted RNase H-like HicB family nuclease